MSARPNCPTDTITGGALRIIHVARRELGIAEENYRALLMRAAGVTSSKALTPEGFDAVMLEFKRLGFVPVASPRKPKGSGGNAPDRPSAAQWRLLEDRACACGFAGLEDPRFCNWIKPRAGVEHARFLDQAGAQKIIGALGNWLARKAAR